jgi:regulator of sigma E protease
VLNTLYSLAAFVFVLGVLVFVHEFGHFLVARWLGVRVITFSIGFGPKIVSFRRGDTEYAISILPLGGYVKMAGENPDDPQTGARDEFLSRGKWDRFRILLAGPATRMRKRSHLLRARNSSPAPVCGSSGFSPAIFT